LIGPERNTFGLAPTSLVAALAGVCFVAAVVLLALGTVVVGLLLLLAALLLAALFFEQARRRRASGLDRIAAAAIDNSKALAGFAGASVRTWTGAGRQVTALRLEAHRLVRERAQVQYALGGAAYAEHAAEAETLRARMRELDAKIAGCAERAQAAVEGARTRTSRERLAISPTEIRRP
jgi:cell division septum initiation protein DivIVA